MKQYIEKIKEDYQNGFRDGRSVTDKIFALKIINLGVKFECTVFIDFQKAYDPIHHRHSMEMCGRI